MARRTQCAPPLANPRARHANSAKLPIKRYPPSPSDSGAMPPLYPRTMEDVDDAEEAELRWLEGRAPGRIAPLPSSSTFAASAPRLDAPSPLPTATIDLTSEVDPQGTLPMVPSTSSGHIQATQRQAPPQLPTFHSPPRRHPANAAPHAEDSMDGVTLASPAVTATVARGVSRGVAASGGGQVEHASAAGPGGSPARPSPSPPPPRRLAAASDAHSNTASPSQRPHASVSFTTPARPAAGGTPASAEAPPSISLSPSVGPPPPSRAVGGSASRRPFDAGNAAMPQSLQQAAQAAAARQGEAPAGAPASTEMDVDGLPVCKVIASRVEGTVVSLCLTSDATGQMEWLTDRAMVEARARPRADTGTAAWSCDACGADGWCSSRALVCVTCGAPSPMEAARERMASWPPRRPPRRCFGSAHRR